MSSTATEPSSRPHPPPSLDNPRRPRNHESQSDSPHGGFHPSPPSPLSIPVWNPTESQNPPSTSKIDQNMLRRNGLVLQLKSSTWVADSHGLYDYESRNVHVRVLKCNCFRDVYHIVRVGNLVQLLGETQANALYASDSRSKALAVLTWSNGTYTIGPVCSGPSTNRNDRSHHEHLWLVVRTLKDRGVGLVSSDVIKLGRYRIKVKEIVVSSRDAKAMGSGRFLVQTDDDDDCETEAPDLVEFLPIDNLENLNDENHEEIEYNNNNNPPIVARNIPPLVIQNSTSSIDTPREQPRSLRLSPRSSPRSTNHCSLNASSASCIENSAPDSSVPKPYQYMDTINSTICRICLCGAEENEADNEANPLVAPCECKGSMKWVHLMCLRTWMAGRLNIKSDNSMVCFFWRSLECELCKVLYPTLVKIVDPNKSSSSDDEKRENKKLMSNTDSTASYRRMSDSRAYQDKSVEMDHCIIKKSISVQDYRTIELFELPRPEIPYVILEPRGQQCRGLHVVSLANSKNARLGRGHDTDIRLADISVSRLHALLRFQPPVPKRSGASVTMAGSTGTANIDLSDDGCFVIEDNRSKFGTLIEVRKPFRLDPQSTTPISFQVGRTLLTFTMKRRWRFMFSACLRNSQPDVCVVLHQAPLQASAGNSSALFGRTEEPPQHQPPLAPPLPIRGAVDAPSDVEEHSAQNLPVPNELRHNDRRATGERIEEEVHNQGMNHGSTAAQQNSNEI